MRLKNQVNFNSHLVMSNDIDGMSQPYVPSQLRVAYNVPEDALGCGKTIAIIDAYGSPDIVKEVEQFNERYNLPDLDLQVLFPQGKPEQVEPGWAIETALDVEWAHAMAPLAKIDLIVAKSNSAEDLFGAVQYAINRGEKIISMSWGAEEFDEQLMLDSIFKVDGIAFFASSGDSVSTSYPAASPYVVAVGGTSLQLNYKGKLIAPEITWVDSGGGVSQFEPKPSYQYVKTKATPQTDNRSIPDVALFADPLPGVSIYTTQLPEDDRWTSVGGTSVSAPCVAGIYASVDDGNCSQSIHERIYSLYKFNSKDKEDYPYFDVCVGSNTVFFALKGFDYVSGVGSLNAEVFIEKLSSNCSCKNQCYCNQCYYNNRNYEVEC